MPSTPPPCLSVVVPTYSRPDRIADLLARLADQTLAPERFEVIVVDDGSPDPVRAPDSTPFALTVLRQENRGPGAARNTALAHCRGALCLILNDDAVPSRELLQGHVDAHAELARERRDKLAVLGTFRFTNEARRSAFTQLLDRSDLLFEFSPLVDRREYGWPFFWTCNVSLPTCALREVGGFDAERFHDVLDDCELGWRLEQRGWRVLHRADLLAEHEHVLTPAGFFARTRKLGHALARMYAKHGDARVLRLAAGTTPDRTVLRQWQATYESLRAQQEKVQTLLEKLERDQSGSELPQALVTQLATLVARSNAVPLCRGLLEELGGHDPELVRTHGARASRLVSIVMPSFDALPATQRALAALRACASERHPQEVIVVDNGSSDGSREWLAAQPDVRLIANETNLGAPYARNQALRAASGEWIVFMDNDVLVTPHWLERLLYHAQIDPRAGCIGPLSDRAAHGQQIAYPHGDDPAQLARFAEAHHAAHARTFRMSSLLSSFLVLVPRHVIDAIGGFDERFAPWGFEDDDFTLRAALHAGHTRVALDVFVRHLGYAGAHSAAKAAKHAALLERNWALFRDKWRLPHDARRGDYAALQPLLARTWSARELKIELHASDHPVGIEAHS